MKKIALLIVVIFFVACGAHKELSKTNSLFSVLASNDYGGNKFQFYEIITEANEFKMFLGDKTLKRLVKPEDINTCNFLLLNMGEKDATGYKIEVTNVQEFPDKVVVTVKESAPDTASKSVADQTFPYSIVKINSKKKIEIAEAILRH